MNPETACYAMVITLTAIQTKIYHVRQFRDGMNPETACSVVLTS